MSTIPRLAKTVGEQLLKRGEWLATAESCTGGLISGAITDIAGSSAWFGSGFVTYSNEAKCRMLEVDPKTLEAFGAVSAEVVGEMAEGARQLANADWSVAVSGIAGPTGGSVSKPIGTIWFAIAGPKGVETFCHHFSGDRQSVRRQTVEAALSCLLVKLS